MTRGDRIQAVGRMETGPAGDIHLEVQTVTNLRTNDSPKRCPSASPRPAPTASAAASWPEAGERPDRDSLADGAGEGAADDVGTDGRDRRRGA